MKTYYFSAGDYMHVHGCVIAEDKQKAIELINEKLTEIDVLPRMKESYLIEVHSNEVVVGKSFI